MLRKETQYVQTVHECLRNERESRNKKREGASLGTHQSAPYTRPARVSTVPLNSPSPQERPAKWTHKKFKNKQKRANRGSFLFDFKIPGIKEEGTSWSWCPTKACSFPKEASSCNSSQPQLYYRHHGLKLP